MRRFIDLVEQTLCEMIVRYKADHPEYIVAHRDSIWLVGSESDPSVFADIRQKTGLEAKDFQDISELRENRPDVLIAYYNDGEPSLDGIAQGLNPYTSKLLYKVAKQLNLTGYSWSKFDGDEDEWEETVDKFQLLGKLPDVLFHGTTTKYLYQIMSQGLRPDTPHGNWDTNKIKFPDRVFLAADPSKAMFHANDGARKQNGSFPIVIATRIPDRNLIDLDFDVASQFYGVDHDKLHHSYRTVGSRIKKYDDPTPSLVQKHSPKTDFTRETGVLSYKGRVPASMFQYVIVPSIEGPLDSHNQETVSDMKEFRKYLDMFIEYGYYDPIAFDEIAMYQDEEDEY